MPKLAALPHLTFTFTGTVEVKFSDHISTAVCTAGFAKEGTVLKLITKELFGSRFAIGTLGFDSIETDSLLA